MFRKGEIFLYMPKEDVFTHAAVKTPLAVKLGGLFDALDLGDFYINGVLVTNVEADWSGNPDMVGILWESLESGKVQTNLGGRSIAYPRGRVVGGSSAINAMIYMRGQAADYDGWRQLGLAGWGWDACCPISSARRTITAARAPCMGRAANGGSSARASRGRSSTPCARPGSRSYSTKIDDSNRGDKLEVRAISRSTSVAGGVGARRTR